MNTLKNFLSNGKKKVALNSQVSTWTSVNAGVPQGFMLSLLLFLIFIIDLCDNLSSNVKLFVDDTSLLSAIHDISVSAGQPNEDLKKNQRLGFSMENNF